MDVLYWEGGLLRHEVCAIEEMEDAFQNPKPASSSSHLKGGMAEQLKALTAGAGGMWPWRGYAGFRFADARGSEGEFDLVIVTHKNVLIVELKHWNGEITSNGGKWYQNGDERGRSPVAITQNKSFLLQRKLQAVKKNLPDGRVPNIQFCVVLSGDCKFSSLPESDLKHVLTLADFLKLANEGLYNKRFRPHPNAQGLNQYFSVFDRLFSKGNTKPKELVVDGFRAQEIIFEHPGKVYVEHQAKNDNNKHERALLRLWDFSKLDDVDAKTPEGRFKILSRERDVLVYLSNRDLDLGRRCLRPMKNPSRDSVTQEYSELCELPSEHYRLNEFINRFVEQFDEAGRVRLAKVMVAQFATMHGFKVAHRDLGDHSIWFSPDSNIALSNFIAAYHQPAGTVGPRRDQLSIGAICMPEDATPDARKGTPFQRDVFALGLMCWHLITANALPLKFESSHIADVRQKLKNSDAWYSEILIRAIEIDPSDRYTDAGILLEELNRYMPRAEGEFEFDHGVLERFALPGFVPYKAFPVDEQLVDSDSKDVYRSGSQIVKMWPNLNATSVSKGEGPMLLAFFERLEVLQKSSYDFLPAIESFGYGRSGTPFVIQRHIDGNDWDELPSVARDTAFVVARKLITAVECLHEQQIVHGDLHPKNVRVALSSEAATSSIYILDMPDICASGIQPFNHRYSPLLESCTDIERDNFAVMRMSVELLGMDWDEARENDISVLREAINQEQQSESGFISLERFKVAFEQACSPPKPRPTIAIDIVSRDGHGDFTVYPDNGRLYVKIDQDLQDQKLLVVSFDGVGGAFRATYDPSLRAFIKAFAPRVQDNIRLRDIQNADFEIDVSIRVSTGSYSNLTSLTEFMAQQSGFGDLAVSILKEQSSTILSDGEQMSSPLAESTIPARVDQPSPEPSANLYPVAKVWKAILETEPESLPSIEVSDTPKLHKDRLGLLIPYTAERDILESFDAEDAVFLSKRKDGVTSSLGVIDTRKSTLTEIYLVLSARAQGIKVDDQLFLQSQAARTSFSRRKHATERLLKRSAVVPNLVDYFDENCDAIPESFGDLPNEQHFKMYERPAADGSVIGLNDAQKEAFARLVNNGPLGLLQGPPGTGKTEFIAAFCHYLISVVGVRNILLTSQSHEAVNTAAERIRSHSRKLKTDLDIVRFSNSEQAVSDELRDVYSRSIVSQQRESFRAEMAHRLSLMAPSLGVSAVFLEELIAVQRKVGGLVKGIARLTADLNSMSDREGSGDVSLEAIDEMRSELLSLLRHDFEIEVDEEDAPSTWLEQVQEKIAGEFGIRAHERKRCLALIELSSDMIERMGSDRANYDEFLLRSRTLVCGTCVGIGVKHLSLADSRFDWVIIDEAARSSPTELAIAMQVGRRVLLVGDHRQLPPFYDTDHRKAIARALELSTASREFQSIMRSDFERVFDSPYGQLASATLKTQYRMQPAIGDMVSDVFYDGFLETGKRPIPAHFDQVPDCLKNVCTWLDTGALGNMAHHQSPKGSSSLTNQTEADSIIQLLKEIEQKSEFSDGLINEMSQTQEPSIGIICMYGEQKKLVRRKFAEQNWPDAFRRLVKIDTVDSYQGKENRIVIISLTRSWPDQIPGFLASPNRVNVALSRAMDRLVIVGDMRMWAGKNAKLPLGRVSTFIRQRQHEMGYAIRPAKGVAK
ncbi:AAA domain-containing protein [Pseudomonas putida]|uniref:AAA domain-containing protein n=1 Tax=Pseudomonas TaxID=286 RepID=UPI001BAD5F71|nr:MULTISPECIES: AAA domain-containing protein [Pseudomonas]MDH1405068.1 AAA domain-containing protein [Pseudomonas sp. GD03730]MDH1778083.1 AAA domain-containing protein [Pseudomonas sp. GD03817]QUE73823.1 NERD domain-containing protein [Pseudomonas aeruginosa]